jgi:hypothetical protein
VLNLVWENDLNSHYERAQCAKLYREYTKYGCVDDDDLLNPSTPVRSMMLAVIMAWTSRVLGDLKRAEEFINEARAISGLVYDDPSTDSYLAFTAMACYYTTCPRGAHYANIAYSLVKQLPVTSKHVKRIQYESYKYAILVDASLPINARYRAILQHAQVYTDGTAEAKCSDCDCEKCTKIPNALHIIILQMIAIILLKIETYYDACAHIRLLECAFTPKERQILVDCYTSFHNAITANPDYFGGNQTTWKMIFKTIEAVVLFRDGKIEESKEACKISKTFLMHKSIPFAMSGNTGPMVLLCELAIRLGLLEDATTMGTRIATMTFGNDLYNIKKLLKLNWAAIDRIAPLSVPTLTPPSSPIPPHEFQPPPKPELPAGLPVEYYDMSSPSSTFDSSLIEFPSSPPYSTEGNSLSSSASTLSPDDSQPSSLDSSLSSSVESQVYTPAAAVNLNPFPTFSTFNNNNNNDELFLFSPSTTTATALLFGNELPADLAVFNLES